MLISSDELRRRLSNPLNLLNKSEGKGKGGAMSLFIKPSMEKESSVNPPLLPAESQIKEEPAEESSRELPNPTEDKATVEAEIVDSPKVDDLIDDLENKVGLSLAHDNALNALNEAINLTRTKMDDMKADKLPSVVTAMSKVVDGIIRAKQEQQKLNKGDVTVRHVFYMPEQKKISDYEVVEVG